jgi:hypothetical protein
MRPDASTMLIAPSTFCTPCEWCSIPRACMRKLDLAVPHHSAAWRISRSGMPVTSAVGAGVQVATCSATLSKPTVNCSMKGRSIHPFSIIRWSTPLKRAMSRPGLTGRNRSQVRASGVMRGSTTMIRAPFSRACQTYSVVIGAHSATLAPLIQIKLGLGNVAPRVRGPVDAERLLVAQPRRSPCTAGRCSRCRES